MAKPVVGLVALVVSATLAGFVGAAAQEMLFKGTVVAVEKATIQVKTVDDDGKPTGQLEPFAITDKTKVLRGGKGIALADAKITSDEAVTIVVVELLVPEEGIEPTRAVKPTRF